MDKNNISKSNRKYYKFKFEENRYKGKLLDNNDSILKFKICKLDREFKKANISQISQRKFSVVNTLTLVATSFLVISIGSFLADPKINVPINPSSPN